MTAYLHIGIACAMLTLPALTHVASAQSTSSRRPATPLQPTGRPPAPAPLDTVLTNFFVGSWTCAGQFASGKPIASTATFATDLANHWLQYRHDDLPPNGFHAFSFWGVNAATGKFTSVMHDNFGSARLFLSTGWNGQSITLDGATLGDADSAGVRQSGRRERFSYTRESDTSFRMRYEVSSDAGQSWRLGDFLVCTRAAR